MPIKTPSTIDSNSPLLAAALTYAQGGLPVYPCFGVVRVFGANHYICRCKAGGACAHPGKHPLTRNGFYDATTDPRIIQYWWHQQPQANVAIRLGTAADAFVVDADARHGGDVTLADHERQNSALPDAGCVITGSGAGSMHFYFACPATGAPIGSGVGALGPGLDLLGEGGPGAIAPSSLHFSGRRYGWLHGAMPKKFPPAPAWLLELARASSARVSDHGWSGSGILTKDHLRGQLIAKLLGAEDRGQYWRFECPLGNHQTPDASMLPREFGAVYFKCWSSAAHTHDEIAAVVREWMKADG